MEGGCWVCVLVSELTGRYYTGSAEDVDWRLEEHNRGRVASTRAHRPWKLVFREWQPDRAAATARERQIKSKKSRQWIEFHLLGGK